MSLIQSTIRHDIRLKLNITPLEYILLDLIHYLKISSGTEYCEFSMSTLANDVGVTRQTIITLFKKLENRGLLIKNKNTKFVKTSFVWDNNLKDVDQKQYIKQLEKSILAIKKHLFISFL